MSDTMRKRCARLARRRKGCARSPEPAPFARIPRLAPKLLDGRVMTKMMILESCTSCAACEEECVPSAISAGDDGYVIDAGACDGCESEHTAPRCVEVCPIDGCIVVAA